MRKVVLNCETYRSSVKSMCNIFECSDKELTEYISLIDLDKIYNLPEGYPQIPSTEYLMEKVLSVFPIRRSITHINWFHLTRIIEGSNFQDGIIPLGNIINKIWDNLVEVFKKRDVEIFNNLLELRASGVNNGAYSLKTNDSMHFGPYAMLVKEAAFQFNEIGNVDYLGMPEIIQDICSGYKDRFHRDIYETVKSILKPCIVTFQKPVDYDEDRDEFDYIEPVLFYIHTKLFKVGMSIYSNTCFDGRNQKVDKREIISIDYI